MTDTETAEPGLAIPFERDRETKNTVRYNEVVAPDATPSVRNVYINKTDCAILGNPERIEVRIVAVTA